MPLLPTAPINLLRTQDFNEEEERKRRRLPAPLSTPPLTDPNDPNKWLMPPPPALPEAAPLARSMPLPTPTTPLPMPSGAGPKLTNSPLNDYRGNAIGDMADFQRDQFVRKGGTTDESGKFKVKRSLKDSLIGAGLGFLQGTATGGGLGAGLGGALAGGIGTAVNPTAGREMIFNATQAPMLQAQQAKEQARIRDEREAQMSALKQEGELARIDELRSQADKNRRPPLARPERPPAPQLRLGRNRESGVVQHYNALDPAQAAMFEPYERPRAAPPPYSASSQGIYDRRTGEITAPAPQKAEKAEKAANPPATAYKRAEQLAQMKQKASEYWTKAQALPQGEERQRVERLARSAQERYNNGVTQFGELYGEHFDVGQDAGGWGYVKKRKTQPRAKSQGAAPLSRPSTSKAQPKANLKDLEKLWR